MNSLAAKCGIFVGVMIGSVLKIAGPELKTFLVGVIREAFKDTAEIAKPNADMDRAFFDGLLPDKPRNPEPRTGGRDAVEQHGGLPGQERGISTGKNFDGAWHFDSGAEKPAGSD